MAHVALALAVASTAAWRFCLRWLDVRKAVPDEESGSSSHPSLPRRAHIEYFARGYRRHEVSAALRSEFARKEHPDSKISADVDKTWRRHRKSNPRLFNRTKFRYHSSEFLKDRRRICLSLWLTDYKTYLGVDFGEFAEERISYGAKVFGNPAALLSRKLGVSCLLLSKDEKLIFIRRSQHVAVQSGKIDCPGGHPEPSNIKCISELHEFSDLASSNTNLSLEVVNEIFNSTIHEIRDEVNVPIESLDDPVLLGATHMPLPRSSVSLAFLINCKLESLRITELYNQGAPESFESTELLAIPMRSVLKRFQRKEFIKRSEFELSDSKSDPQKLENDDIHQLAFETLTPALRGALTILSVYIGEKVRS